jgi:hypothetical protein
MWNIMTEITLPIILQILQTAGLLVGIVYYIMVLRNQQKSQKHAEDTREAQLFMNIYNKIETRENTERIDRVLSMKFDSVEEFHSKYGLEANPEAYYDVMHVSDLIEGVGVLVKEGLVDIRLVVLLMSGMVTNYWRNFEIVWMDFRENRDWPRASVEVEYLYHEVMKYAKKHPEQQIK